MAEENYTFGARLKQLRRERGMSLEAVAKAVGLTKPTVSRYENGQITNVDPERVHQLANLFGVTRPYLMGWTDERGVNPDANLDMVAERLRTSSYMKEDGRVSRWGAMTTSDCTTAATQALRALLKFRVARTPIYPQQILQASPVATLITYADPVELSSADSELVVSTLRKMPDGREHYVFCFNRNAPIGELSLQLCVHIGHIYLGHTGSQHACTKRREAECFAVHLKFPRPMIRLLQERGYVFTKESFSRVFGYCDMCLDSILLAHPVRVSPELNQMAKEQFAPYVDMLEEMGLFVRDVDGQEELDLSRYMDGYEE